MNKPKASDTSISSSQAFEDIGDSETSKTSVPTSQTNTDEISEKSAIFDAIKLAAILTAVLIVLILIFIFGKKLYVYIQKYRFKKLSQL